MPEYPEVYTISSDLNKEIRGKKIISVKVLDPALVRPTDCNLNNIVGLIVIKVDRVAKNIVLHLEKDLFLMFHLRMTGRLLYRPKGFIKDPYTKIIFDFGENELRFTELRRFGYAELCNLSRFSFLVSQYGPALTKITLSDFSKRIKSKRANIKTALLDQTVIAGIGNIYVNDALWLAKIYPATLTRDLPFEKIADLYSSLNEILNEGIKNRGSTLKDKMYVDIYGREGFQQNYFRIYGKAGKPCLRCGGKIDFFKVAGRGTFYCSNCQPIGGISGNLKLEI